MVEGTSLVAVTNGVGRFRLEDVPAGSVVLVVQAQGFLELRVPDVQVSQDQTLQLTVELEVTPNHMERPQVTATKTPLSIGDVAALSWHSPRVLARQIADRVQATAAVLLTYG